MNFIGHIYHSIFVRMPYPIRFLMNLIVLPFVVVRTIWLIVTDKTPTSAVHMMNVDDLLAQMAMDERDSDASDAVMKETLAKAHGMIQAERWSQLSDFIQTLDQERAATPGGERLAPAIVEAIWHTVLDGADYEFGECEPVPVARIPMDRVERYLDIARAHPDSYALSAIAARLCLNVGWGLRGGDFAPFVSDTAFDGMKTMFEAAEGFLQNHDAQELSSPLLAGVRYHLLSGIDCTLPDLTAAFRLRQDLDPTDLSVLGDHGFYLLPRWYGDYDVLDDQAREAHARVHQTLGAAGYAWFYLPLFGRDDGAVATVEMGLLEDGIRDRLSFSKDPQVNLNVILDMLYNASCVRYGEHPSLEAPRAQLREIFVRLVREKLHVVLPSCWSCGRDQIIYRVAEAFEDEIVAGEHVRIGEVSPLPAE